MIIQFDIAEPQYNEIKRIADRDFSGNTDRALQSMLDMLFIKDAEMEELRAQVAQLAVEVGEKDKPRLKPIRNVRGEVIRWKEVD